MGGVVRARKGRAARTIVVVGAVTVAALAVIAAFVLTRPGSLRPAPPGDRTAPDVEVVMYQGEAAVGGTKVRLSQLWGKRRPVVVNFWAGLCPPCRAELPEFQALYDQKAQGRFFLIGVDIGPFVGLGSREEGKALLRELNITFPVGTTFDTRPLSAYQILGMPTTVFITAEGRILRKYVGLLTRTQMDTFVAELLKASNTR